MLVDAHPPTFGWGAHPEVAWTEGVGRVAIVDLRRPDLDVRVCPEPAASLWRLLAGGVVTEDELLARAEELVGDQAPAMLDAVLETFLASGLIERQP